MKKILLIATSMILFSATAFATHSGDRSTGIGTGTDSASDSSGSNPGQNTAKAAQQCGVAQGSWEKSCGSNSTCSDGLLTVNCTTGTLTTTLNPTNATITDSTGKAIPGSNCPKYSSGQYKGQYIVANSMGTLVCGAAPTH